MNDPNTTASDRSTQHTSSQDADPMADAQPYDVIVIGGGPAGLQAALTLGRMHRMVLLLDSGEYRNAPAHEMHNFVTHDGTPPDEFRKSARADLDAYATVEVREVAATEVVPTDIGWRVSLATRRAQAGETSPAGESSPHGDHTLLARKLILATGVRDTLPSTPGLADLWGDLVAHCPFCHGHELAGRHVAVLGSGPHVPRLALLMSRIASRVTVLPDGVPLDDPTTRQLAQAGVAVRMGAVTGVRRTAPDAEGVTHHAGATIGFASGPDVEVDGIFIKTEMTQSAPFAEQLGLEMLPSGCIKIDELGRTSRAGVYAAGDLAHLATLPMPLASVLAATSAGLVAASMAVQELLSEDHELPAPPMPPTPSTPGSP